MCGHSHYTVQGMCKHSHSTVEMKAYITNVIHTHYMYTDTMETNLPIQLLQDIIINPWNAYQEHTNKVRLQIHH